MKFRQFVLAWGGLVAAFLTAPALAAPPESAAAPAGEAPHIYIAEMTYGLFMALTDYQELSELESQQGQDVNARMQPVLLAIIDEFSKEKSRFELLRQEQPQRGEELQARIQKIDRHLQDFSRELVYRNRAAEVERLMRQQKELMERQE